LSVKEHGQRVFIWMMVVVFFITSLAITGFAVLDMVQNKDKKSASSSTADLQKQLQDQLNKQQESAGAKVESTDQTVGTGAEAVAGKKVTVNYTGTLKSDGSKFDSSLDRNQPFSFTLGGGQVIKGWDQGVVGMKVGGKRTLVIPAALAYGDQSPSPKIPPNSDLVFVIELLKVE
jgi:FKBP-type peptidyl-prolyl cis-trans isomerase